MRNTIQYGDTTYAAMVSMYACAQDTDSPRIVETVRFRVSSNDDFLCGGTVLYESAPWTVRKISRFTSNCRSVLDCQRISLDQSLAEPLEIERCGKIVGDCLGVVQLSSSAIGVRHDSTRWETQSKIWLESSTARQLDGPCFLIGAKRWRVIELLDLQSIDKLPHAIVELASWEGG